MDFGTKINIFGNAGTGKSTLARQIGALLDLPVYHLDRYFWDANWTEREDHEFIAKLNEIRSMPAWIMDGNYLRFLFEERIEESDLVIFLDFKRILSVYRVIKRYFQNRKKVRKDICSGCNEKLDWGFIKWVWGFEHRVRPSLLNTLLEYQKKGKRIYIFRNKKELKTFMKTTFGVQLTKGNH